MATLATLFLLAHRVFSADNSAGVESPLSSNPSDHLLRESVGRLWTTAQASELYDVSRWGKGYFSVGANGHLQVHPTKDAARKIDLKDLVDTL
ncbi:MAG: hypothetical protein ACE5JI_09825, partial [Acidobacteriota bacterium]